MFYLFWFFIGFLLGMIAIINFNSLTEPEKTIERLKLLQDEQEMIKDLESARANLELRLKKTIDKYLK